jgi:hypothetical protein
LELHQLKSQDQLTCVQKNQYCFLTTLHCPAQCQRRVPTDPTAKACFFLLRQSEAVCQSNFVNLKFVKVFLIISDTILKRDDVPPQASKE